MPTKLAKQKIAQTFGKASSSYDNSARLQRYSGQALLSFLPLDSDYSIADLGCGTGFFTNIMSRKYRKVIGLDISPQMLSFAKENRNSSIEWIEGDIHALPFEDNSLDVVFSNLAIQWCNPLTDVLKEIKRVLKPGGTLVFTSLLDGTLFELKNSWQQVDNDQHVIDFKTFEEIKNDAIDSGLMIADLKQSSVVLEYHSVRHLAGELKGLGANHVSGKTKKGLAGKTSWQKMTAAYEQFKGEQGSYPATYQLLSAVLIKD